MEIGKERAIAWYFLDERKKEQKGWEETWRPNEAKENYLALFRVAAFWLLVKSLYESHELNERLAHSLLDYEFRHWQPQFSSLVEVTKIKEGKLPDILKPMESMDWFSKKK